MKKNRGPSRTYKVVTIYVFKCIICSKVDKLYNISDIVGLNLRRKQNKNMVFYFGECDAFDFHVFHLSFTHQEL